MDDFENKLTELHDRVLSKALTEDEQNSYTESLFESIKHINEYGEEFWYARELQRALEYTEWRNFSRVIDRAVTACENSGNDVFHHFVEVNKTIDMPKSATKEITDYALSRYACYLIVQNGDSRKKVIALGQTYFAVKTRQQELIDNFNELNEDQKRLAIRVETNLDYAIFQNYGYRGLYGGMDAKAIHHHKGLKPSQKILDHMGYEELAANLFRATQTEAKIKRDNIQGKENANQTHYNVGKEVRDTISRLGGTMPEDLPTQTKRIKQIDREQKKLEDR